MIIFIIVSLSREPLDLIDICQNGKFFFSVFYFSLTIHWMQNNVTHILQCFEYMSYIVWHMWVFSHGFMAMNPFDWQNDALTHKFALRFSLQNWWFVCSVIKFLMIQMTDEFANSSIYILLASHFTMALSHHWSIGDTQLL